jgi:hypothetical protein
MLQFLEQISHNTRQQVGEIQAQRTQAISGVKRQLFFTTSDN